MVISIFNMFIGYTFWLLDYFYCDNILISYHFVWHIYSANAIYYLNLFLNNNNINKFNKL